ncbi:helix-turn-helix domain-containing protein [Alicyclobacillus mengziensis]|uniref:Helix-turn-helix transcriptional regulator n=1 Tax=Alicyclobacillus mengziensis TaxID=2931921 RepID=A0A9X7Z942_9BACL|nr:helix-turn-helix transcriptional regulator [Alicyclobacillus mengziensis]QSO49173.1 helix-turn-helix transcriptional regulator [Alicyclobacillus mengziensis]
MSQETGVSFGEFVKRLLETNGMSMRDLAGRAGIDQAHVTRVLNGKRNPTASFVRKIAKHLIGTSYEELLIVAGIVDAVRDDENDEPLGIEKLESKIREASTRLIRLYQLYSKTSHQPRDIDTENEFNVQTAVLSWLWESSKNDMVVEHLGYFLDMDKVVLASKLQGLKKQQLGIVNLLLAEFHDELPGQD